MTEQSLALQLADSADACQLTVHDCFLVAKELRRLHDLLGKANALARIRANKIDELEQQITKTEAQLGESVWNYGELKREQLANQQKTSGSPVVSELHCICGAEWEWHNHDWELVTTPQPQREWVGLTEDEVIECTPTWGGTVEDVARLIEAKLKEKNT